MNNPEKGISVSLVALWMALASPVARGAALSEGCFDFSPHAAQSPSPLQESSRVKTAKSGTLDSDVVWALEERVISRPLPEIVSELMKHQATKSQEVSSMSVDSVPDSRFLVRQKVDFEVYPFPFITISWKEDWVFVLQSGKPQDPERVWVGYQKAGGTSHIRHLCGSYLLSRKTGRETHVSLYEEVFATRRSLEDTKDGIRITLDRLGQAR